MKKITVLIIIIFSCLHLYAQAFKIVQRTRIDFGPEPDRVGIEKGGGEHWKPLFFSIDESGIIHIPDFYKQRIALFNKQGQLVAFKKCLSGISPRMNYFSLAANGSYITFDNGTLYKIGADGKMDWQYNFGMGIIPRRIIPTDMAIFVLLPLFVDNDGRTLVFDYATPRPLGRFGQIIEGKSIPLIQAGSNNIFTLNLKQMSTLPEYKQGFKCDQEAALLYVTSDGVSVWWQKNDYSEKILFFDKQGRELGRGIISYPEGVAGTGFWTYVDDNLIVYKNYFYDDYMEIVGYSF